MVSLWYLFFLFMKIGFFTFGGGLAMIPIIKKEIVDRGWIEETVLEDYIAVAQVAPGMISVNIATLVGKHIRGRWGAVVTALGVALPSLIVISIIAAFAREFLDYPLVASALKGVIIVVVILLGYALITTGKHVIKNIFSLVYAIAVFAAVFFFEISTVLALLSAFIIGTIHAIWIYRKRAD
jgi:chromate transporter